MKIIVQHGYLATGKQIIKANKKRIRKRFSKRFKTIDIVFFSNPYETRLEVNFWGHDKGGLHFLGNAAIKSESKQLKKEIECLKTV